MIVAQQQWEREQLAQQVVTEVREVWEATGQAGSFSQ